MACAEEIRLEVVFGIGPHQVDASALRMPVGTTLNQALNASGVLERHALDVSQLLVGVWGKAQSLDAVLREGDRVEIYRPLTVDPKEARRLRYRQQSPDKASRRRGRSQVDAAERARAMQEAVGDEAP